MANNLELLKQQLERAEFRIGLLESLPRSSWSDGDYESYINLKNKIDELDELIAKEQSNA